ncbi:tyrosine-protein phosphatase [Nocardia iowensis]|uniref:Tyrosine-protein phosphatase n=1 Tax=Nocardia iowensis TaxID=204891 RepID=A0ABX8S354_NOCIO|nr:tyrosine-protein phosphatase [Nocardia iowensis]QXN95025.1 tyrosine-protein phosphatase [Nocardia iowensis]
MHTDLTPRRWVEFAEIDNVRDLGGLPVSGGGTTRFGVVYRSSTPQQLSETDLAYLLGPVGLRTLVDLRMPMEVAREGYGRLAKSTVRLVNLPISVPASTATPAELAPDARRYDLRKLYHGLLSGSAASVVSAARLIADTRQHSVVFHCAAGKDRTGVLAAILLDAVGVPAAAIVADYALTAERIERIRARLDTLHSYHGLPPVRTGILAVDPATMLRFVDDLHADYGGAAGWLRANGLTDAELAALRRAMVA